MARLAPIPVMKKRALAILFAIIIPSVAFAAATADDSCCSPCCDNCPFFK